jgi:hypothetical protein
MLWSLFVYEAAPRAEFESQWARPVPKLGGGFRIKAEVRELMSTTVGMTAQRDLEEAGFDQDLVWESWTVRFNQGAMLVCSLFVCVATGVALAASGSIPPARH